MSALVPKMSALTPIADIHPLIENVRFGPTADIASCLRRALPSDPIGRRLFPDRCPTKRGTMLRSIPWDVWAAAAIAVVVGIAAIFDPTSAIFIVIFLGLCAYIAAQTFGSDSN